MASNHHDEFFKKVIEAMESGKLDWSKPWSVTIRASFNATTGKRYHGINRLILAMEEDKKGAIDGFIDPRWATFLQIHSKGWKLKKGSKGAFVKFYGKIKAKEKDGTIKVDKDGNPEYFDCIKWSAVFNARDIEGIEPYEAEGENDKREILLNEMCESIIENCGVRIHYGGNRAFYTRDLDEIWLPRREHFKSDEHFYATALHEIAHSTGHKSRLARDFGGKFGDKKYAFEELVAEITCAYVMSDLGLHVTDDVGAEHINHHAAYIQSWIEGLKDNNKALDRAMSLAEKATQMIMGYCKVGDKEGGNDEKFAAE